MISKSERIVRAGLPDQLARLWRYGLVLTKDRDAAEMLTQATILKIVETADEYKIGTPLQSWFFTVMAQVFREMGKNKIAKISKRRLPKIEARSIELDPHMRQMFEYVLTLPLTQRVTIFLVYVEGYKYREAADLMNVPLGTVMSRLSLARKMLNAIVDDGRDLLTAG